MAENCVFCKIVEGEIPSNKVYETDKVIAFLDANPATKGHTLVVPKKHVGTIHEAEGMEYMWDAIVKVSNAVRKAFNVEGMNIDQNNGEIAGQEVDHMHFHVTPRYDRNEIRIEYDRKELENGEEIAETISENL